MSHSCPTPDTPHLFTADLVRLNSLLHLKPVFLYLWASEHFASCAQDSRPSLFCLFSAHHPQFPPFQAWPPHPRRYELYPPHTWTWHLIMSPITVRLLVCLFPATSSWRYRLSVTAWPGVATRNFVSEWRNVSVSSHMLPLVSPGRLTAA